MKQNQQLVKMQQEIIRLQKIIRQHESNEAQTAFLENLNAAALSGYCSHPWAEYDPIKASELAMKAAEHTIETIIKSVAKAQAEEEKKVSDQIERMAKQSELNKADLEAQEQAEPQESRIAHGGQVAEE